MKAFFTAIKDRISALLGKDATWEDIFQKVDTGEVGAREGTQPLDARAFDEKLSNDNRTIEQRRGDRMDQLIKELNQIDQRGQLSEFDSARYNKITAEMDRLSKGGALDERLSIEEPKDPSRVFERANALGMRA